MIAYIALLFGLAGLGTALWNTRTIRVQGAHSGPQHAAEVTPPPPLQQAVAPSKKPLEINPNNPPRYTSYNPVVGHPPKSCDCHEDRPLTPGQPVLWWPRVDVEGAVFIFCQETYEQAIQR